jgi:hypothetical protein
MSKVKGVADIVVLLDVSGSMQPCIDAVKQSIGQFIASLTATDANNDNPIRDWRMKVCGYRDHEHDGGSWFVDNPFVRDAEAVRAQLSAPSMQGDGGGDEPESLLDALFLLSSMQSSDVQEGEVASKWRDRSQAARIVIFFTDATFKSPMTMPEAAGGTVMDVVNAIMGARIILCGFVPEWEGYYELASADKAEFDVYVTTAAQPAIAGLGQPGEAGRQAMQAAVTALNATVSNPTAFQKVMAQLAKTVTKSAAVELA